MLTEQAPEDLQVRGVLHPLGEDRLRSDRGLLLRLGERDGRELYGEVGEQDYLLYCQCVRAGHVIHHVIRHIYFIDLNKLAIK